MLKRVIPIVIVAAVVVFCGFWFSGKSAVLKLSPPVEAIGAATPVHVEVSDPNGVKSFTAAVEQNGQTQVVFRDPKPSKQADSAYSFAVGKQQASFLKEGSARLVFSAASNDFRGRTATLVQEVKVLLQPPTISADGRQHYINQGGAGLVVLDLGGDWKEAGVRIGSYSVPTFPMPGQPQNGSRRFALIPFSWDVPADTVPVAFAKNAAGTEVTASFWVKIVPKDFHRSNINVTDREMQKVVGALDPGGSGSLVDRFLKLNRQMRKANAETIFNLRTDTENRMLWSGRFVPPPGTREAYFADDRTYFYQGKKIDEEVHLGYDLAGIAHMPVKAANSGRVIYAAPLGIYGNCVIIDHGYSLDSLYGHMSKILVHPGEMVQKQQQIGISGSTGMAFGDHVHFSMLIDGMEVNPKEWWDPHWIRDHILSQIGPNAGAPKTASDASIEQASFARHRHRHHRR